MVFFREYTIVVQLESNVNINLRPMRLTDLVTVIDKDLQDYHDHQRVIFIFKDKTSMIWKGRKSLGTLKKHLFSLGWFCSDWCGLNGGHSLFTDDRRRNHVGMAGQSDLQDFSRPKKGQRSRRSSRSGRQFQALQITKKLFFPSPKSAFKKCLHLRQPINSYFCINSN